MATNEAQAKVKTIFDLVKKQVWETVKSEVNSYLKTRIKELVGLLGKTDSLDSTETVRVEVLKDEIWNALIETADKWDLLQKKAESFKPDDSSSSS